MRGYVGGIGLIRGQKGGFVGGFVRGNVGGIGLICGQKGGFVGGFVGGSARGYVGGIGFIFTSFSIICLFHLV